MSRKQHLINSIKELINPTHKNIEVFRKVSDVWDLPVEKQLYTWNGQTLTREACREIPAKLHIFLSHRVIVASRWE